MTLPQDALQATAAELALPVAVIAAVADVESAGSGFAANGQPAVLFERHWFYRRLQEKLTTEALQQLQRTAPDLVNPTRGGYRGGLAEQERLQRAIAIDETAAIEAASWGLFQLMGLHWPRLGYASATAFRQAMQTSTAEQLAAFGRFIRTDPVLHRALKNLNWAGFARRYNGPAYQANQYDRKLAQAYARHLN